MEINELRKQQIYEIIENPKLTINEKKCEFKKVLEKTDEQIILESKRKRSLEDMYQSLFFIHNVEGESNEIETNKQYH